MKTKLCTLYHYLRFSAISKQQCAGIEDDHRYEQQAIADQHAEVLKPTTNHNPEQVRGKGDVGSLTTTFKRVRKDDVGQKHRREGQDTGKKIPCKWVAQ